VFLADVLLIVGAVLPILNPFGMAPIFYAMTRNLEPGRTQALALRVGLNGFALLTAALLIGSKVLAIFGVSLIAVRIGGGLLLMINGYQLLTSQDADSATPERHTEPDEKALSSLAFYPLTFPLSVGPGSLSVAIALGASKQDSFLASLAGIAVVSLILFLCYRFAHGLSRLLGSTGNMVLLRLSAFILLCIGVQILLNALTEFLKGLR
jgi:multiple antibiotic resistance protein